MVTKVIDNITFKANESDINILIDEIIRDYSVLDDDTWACIQVICDSREVIQTIIQRLTESNMFSSYDISKNQQINMRVIDEISGHTQAVVYGFEEYTSYLQDHVFHDNKVTIYGVDVEESKVKLYHNMINLLRDGNFLRNNARKVFVFSNQEYDIFSKIAPDFCSYSGLAVDFNEIFISDDNVNLSEYYMSKRFPNCLRKKMKRTDT